MSHLRPVHAEERLLDKREIAKLLRCSPTTIDRMRKDGMPAIRWGRKFVRFRASECQAWLDGCDPERRAA